MTPNTLLSPAATAHSLDQALPGHWLLRLRTAAPALFWVGLGLLVASCITVALALVDARLFQGVSVWLKPWKFQFSAAVYLLTLGLFMVWLPAAARQTNAARYVVWVAVASALFEVGYITWQGALGQASHFNVGSRVAAFMYTLMGVGAVLLASASLVLGILIARCADYRLPPALKLSVVLGLLITFVLGTAFGAYLGGQPTGHWVGGALTDAGGMPLFKWSRSGGDLRVAHFFGIHAMHFIPAFGLALAALRVPERQAGAAVWVFAAAFSFWCVWTFVQARMGLPFLP